jgi:transaldolase
MGASFRNCGEIEALAGCGRLTISPTLLEELAADNRKLPLQLSADNARSEASMLSSTEADFRYDLNGDRIAC